MKSKNTLKLGETYPIWFSHTIKKHSERTNNLEFGSTNPNTGLVVRGKLFFFWNSLYFTSNKLTGLFKVSLYLLIEKNLKGLINYKKLLYIYRVP